MALGLQLLTPEHPAADAIVDAIVDLHASCIINDHTMATFIPPLSYERMRARWDDFLKETVSGSRIVLVWICAVKDRSQEFGTIVMPFDGLKPTEVALGEEIAGTVSLSMPTSETGPFRGLVGNLFVSPYHRRKNVASRLLAELEEQAAKCGRWNLMLDTIEGTPADAMYPKLQWERLGVVRDYGISPEDGRLLNEVFYWKDVRYLRNKE